MQQQDTTGRTIAAFSLIGLGVLFLLGQWFSFDLFGTFWTLFVMIPGLVFLTLALRRQDNKTIGFIFPGVLVTGTGLILTYQNLTGHWESWAYIWTLYPAMVGLALNYVGRHTGDESAQKVGSAMTRFSLVAFVGLGALFELFFFNGIGFDLMMPLLPLAMIAIGLYLLLHNRNDAKAKRKAHESY